MKEKKSVGRPRIIKSPETFQGIVDLYFDEIEKYNENPSNIKNKLFKIPIVEEIVYRLGLSSRQSFKEYADRFEYSDTIKKMKTRILMIQKQLAMQNKINPTIAIFNWKNNFGYIDKVETESKNDTTLTIKREIVKVKKID